MSSRLDTPDDVGLRRGRWLQRRPPALLLAVIVVAGLVEVWRAFAQRRVLIEEGKWIGWTEKQLVARVGTPTKSSNEYVCVGRESPPALPAGPHRTLYYETKRGHLCIWLHPTNGTWVCLDSLWFAELDLRAIKQSLGMEPLRCQSPEMVHKEIWAHWLAYNLIRKTIAQAALAEGKLPRTISFAAARQTIAASWDLLSRTPQALHALAGVQFTAIASHQVADRPDRVEPRAVKRRPKPHRLLKKPRAEARAELLHPRRPHR